MDSKATHARPKVALRGHILGSSAAMKWDRTWQYEDTYMAVPQPKVKQYEEAEWRVMLNTSNSRFRVALMLASSASRSLNSASASLSTCMEDEREQGVRAIILHSLCVLVLYAILWPRKQYPRKMLYPSR